MDSSLYSPFLYLLIITFGERNVPDGMQFFIFFFLGGRGVMSF